MTTVGRQLGQDEQRRLRNVAIVNEGLYELHDAGVLPHFEHRTEPGRHDPEQTVDVWVLTFAGETRTWSYPYAQVRALLRGWKLAMNLPRPAPGG